MRNMDRERESFEIGIEFGKQREEIRELRRRLEHLERFVHHHFEAHDVTDFELTQIIGGNTMAGIQGTPVGGTSTFRIGLVPNVNFIPLSAGPVLAVDDSTVAITQPDASGNVTAAVPVDSVATSYNLTVTGTSGKGVALTHTFNIPVIPAPPVLTDVTDFTLDQVS